jgi:hypothetical protein
MAQSRIVWILGTGIGGRCLGVDGQIKCWLRWEQIRYFETEAEAEEFAAGHSKPPKKYPILHQPLY